VRWLLMLTDTTLPGGTGVDLYKILGENQTLWENEVKTDKCMGVSRFLGGALWLTPKMTSMY